MSFHMELKNKRCMKTENPSHLKHLKTLVHSLLPYYVIELLVKSSSNLTVNKRLQTEHPPPNICWTMELDRAFLTINGQKEEDEKGRTSEGKWTRMHLNVYKDASKTLVNTTWRPGQGSKEDARGSNMFPCICSIFVYGLATRLVGSA